MKELTLGPEALSYIDRRLAAGKLLAKHLRERQDFWQGKVITDLPPEVSLEAAANFDAAILPPPPVEVHGEIIAKDQSRLRVVPKPDLLASLVPRVSRFLEKAGDVCLFEDDLASPSDSWVGSLESALVTGEDSVYHILLHGDFGDLRRIEATLRKAYSVSLIAAMTSQSPEARLTRKSRTLGSNTLREFAQRAEMIVTSAYDDQGYLIWLAPRGT